MRHHYSVLKHRKNTFDLFIIKKKEFNKIFSFNEIWKLCWSIILKNDKSWIYMLPKTLNISVWYSSKNLHMGEEELYFSHLL